MDGNENFNEKNNNDDRTKKALEELSIKMDNMRVAEYLALVTKPGRLIWMNFLLGLARGVGMGIGVTVLVALLLYMMRSWVNLPVIGKWIAELVKIIEIYR